MPGFDAIVGQDDPLRLLKILLRKDKIPHALLFTGIDGIGKRTSAIAFAMACQCEHKHRSAESQAGQKTATTGGTDAKNAMMPGVPCGECRQCRRIDTGIHPDVLHLIPSGRHIRIEQIRELCGMISMKPYEAGLRFVVISDAQEMTPEASNALLKVLEEPPDRTIFILTVQQTSDLLPTIVSRCQQIRFNPIPRHPLERLLLEQHGETQEKASIIAGLSGGSYATARKMSKEDWLTQRQWLISAIGLDELGTSVSRSIGEILAYSEKLSQKKERLEASLELLKTWFRDLIIYRFSPEKIIHTDKIENIKNLSGNIGVQALLEKIQAVQTAQNNLRAHSNTRLTLDMMVLRLCGLADTNESS